MYIFYDLFLTVNNLDYWIFSYYIIYTLYEQSFRNEMNV